MYILLYFEDNLNNHKHSPFYRKFLYTIRRKKNKIIKEILKSEEKIMNKKMSLLKRIFSLLAACILTFGLFACGSYSGDAPITAKWKVTQINNHGTVTDMTGAWQVVDAVSGTKVPEFTSDGNNFTFSMSGKDHNGTLVQNGDIYELYWDNTNNTNSPKMSTAKITGNVLEVELKDGIVVTFEAK